MTMTVRRSRSVGDRTVQRGKPVRLELLAEEHSVSAGKRGTDPGNTER